MSRVAKNMSRVAKNVSRVAKNVSRVAKNVSFTVLRSPCAVRVQVRGSVWGSGFSVRPVRLKMDTTHGSYVVSGFSRTEHQPEHEPSSESIRRVNDANAVCARVP
jgi:hypothetical protein